MGLAVAEFGTSADCSRVTVPALVYCGGEDRPEENRTTADALGAESISIGISQVADARPTPVGRAVVTGVSSCSASIIPTGRATNPSTDAISHRCGAGASRGAAELDLPLTLKG